MLQPNGSSKFSDQNFLVAINSEAAQIPSMPFGQPRIPSSLNPSLQPTIRQSQTLFLNKNKNHKLILDQEIKNPT
ncbi:unnamed protein product [Cuscuta campestris]|uniref:Uncharacterized protein n=1 Tax=Cuscuta campestris TaxID=132261 RepID=A0A484L1R7_9ASTE|nr:unnamed protein product [Cuscuta campestris]